MDRCVHTEPEPTTTTVVESRCLLSGHYACHRRIYRDFPYNALFSLSPWFVLCRAVDDGSGDVSVPEFCSVCSQVGKTGALGAQQDDCDARMVLHTSAWASAIMLHLH